jgi:hypothetical protein
MHYWPFFHEKKKIFDESDTLAQFSCCDGTRANKFRAFDRAINVMIT